MIRAEYEVSINHPRGIHPRADRQALLGEIEGKLKRLAKGTEHLFTTVGEVNGGRAIKGQGDVTRGTIYVRMTDLTKGANTASSTIQNAGPQDPQGPTTPTSAPA